MHVNKPQDDFEAPQHVNNAVKMAKVGSLNVVEGLRT